MSSKSVRFAAPAASQNAKRSQRDADIATSDEKSKRVRLNEEEIDDLDDWKKEEIDGEEDIPSERELLEAKRKRRRERAAGVDADGRTQIDDSTSLATDGIQIEPFHMRREESDGAGYFDGDTYIWRKNDPNDEPDAWLDSLGDERNAVPSSKSILQPPKDTENTEDKPENLDGLTKEQLYLKVLPLINGTETVAQAVRRYGAVSKQSKLKSKKGDPSSTEDSKVAKSCLDDLTGAANALLLKGEVDIYDTRRQRILQVLSKHATVMEFPNKQQAPTDWEYKGNQDGQIHGPYTTQQMMGWMQAGYFVGLQKVRIRTIRKKTNSPEDDLMADLMDDDEKADSQEDALEKGEWQWSDEINMKNYLPIP
ncbi:unnamed protein product [Cylindrotheca closterium]|uniref:GYF domain-containing protein n=1 Tax=Cylindrotheca closterium TaxID=2856 RepID=A0AAD2CQZ0_9STRA|nr:unnamed protein product [Cylindrotheca closterium]